MENFKEQIQNLEGKKYSSKIDLHFFRHGESEPAIEENDAERELTQKGKEQSVKRASEDTKLEQAIAFGSSRKRSQQTAGFVMAGKNEIITGNESIDELKDKLESGLKIGKKIGIEEKLNYFEDVSTEYYKRVWEHIRGGDILRFLVNESDKVAKELGDNQTLTYSKSARQIAEIIKKYLKVSPRWNELVTDKTKSYSDTLERFMGTHQTVPESFLAKIIEKTKGVEERDRFIEMLDNKGFNYTEGFDLEILSTVSGPVIHIYYKRIRDKEESYIFDQEVNIELIDEIIDEGK